MNRTHFSLQIALLALLAASATSARAELSPVAARCAETAERFIAAVNAGDLSRAELSRESVDKCVQMLKVRHADEAHDVIERATAAIARVKQN